MMKLTKVILVFIAHSSLLAQNGYPIISEDCYVKIDEGILENIKHAEYLRLSFWGLEHQREEDKNVEYLRNGQYRYVIDSVFRAKMNFLRNKIGDDFFCKRLRLRPDMWFKYHIRSKYGPDPTFVFEFNFNLYCEDIEYIFHPTSNLSFKYYIDKQGGVIESGSTYLSDNYFEDCKYYHVSHVALINRIKDSLNILNTNNIRISQIDSVNYLVMEKHSLKGAKRSPVRYNSRDSIFHRDGEKYLNYQPIKDAPGINILLGKLTSWRRVGAWKVYQFEVSVRFLGGDVDTSIINIANLETSHSPYIGTMQTEQIVRVVKREKTNYSVPLDSIDNLYLFARGSTVVQNSIPDLERRMKEKYVYVDTTNELVHPVIFNSIICDDLENEKLVVYFDRSNMYEERKLSRYLWLNTEKKRRSLIGDIEFVMSYDTIATGSMIVSRGILELSNEFSFSSIGSKPKWSNSFHDSIQIQVVDLTANRIKVRIDGSDSHSWFDFLPRTSGRVNPNVYGPFLRIDLKIDLICSTDLEINFEIDENHLSQQEIKYVDYLCSQGEEYYSFITYDVVNNAKMNISSMPSRFNELSNNEVRLGDTLTIFGEYMNRYDTEIIVRCYGSIGDFNFTKLLAIPEQQIIDRACDRITFVMPNEIPYKKKGFPDKMQVISGFIRSRMSGKGVKYSIIEE